MRLIFHFMLVFLSTLLPAKDLPTRDEFYKKDKLLYLKNSLEPYTGKYANYFVNGNLESITWVKEGIKGRYKVFYDSGKKKVLNYEDENFNNYGKIKVWNEDGSVAFKGKWLNGKMYQKGQSEPFSGECILLYENGLVKEKGEFRNGWWHGKQLWWNRRGEIIVDCMYENNKIVDCKKWIKNTDR